jgi:hypothetical protein
MKIYLVFRNSDFTEGRGPMVFSCAFKDATDAVEYVARQEGIFGSPQKVEIGKHFGTYASANGYDIREVELIESLEQEEAIHQDRVRRRALSKLTREEWNALGLGEYK